MNFSDYSIHYLVLFCLAISQDLGLNMVGNGRELCIQDVVWEGIANAKDLRKDMGGIEGYYVDRM